MRRIFLNRSLVTSAKIAVYTPVYISMFVYGCEVWTPDRRHVKALEAFHARCLRTILGVRWWHEAPHTELFDRADITQVEQLLMQRQLRWLGHLIQTRTPPVDASLIPVTTPSQLLCAV